MSITTKLFDVPLYPARLMVSITDDVIAARKAESERFGPMDADTAECDCNALTSHNEGEFGVFFNRSDMPADLIAHEAFHVTHRIMWHIGSQLAESSMEPYAYLLAWVVRCVMEV